MRKLKWKLFGSKVSSSSVPLLLNTAGQATRMMAKNTQQHDRKPPAAVDVAWQGSQEVPASALKDPAIQSHPSYQTALLNFRYQRLQVDSKEIRLFRAAADTPTIDPFKSGGCMKLELHHFQLQNAPKFLALSYSWGNQAPTYKVMCNESECFITENLAKAISTAFCSVHKVATELYDHDQTYFWADGLCINQKDANEKNVQVKLMTQIYQKAASVLGYIGAPKSTHPHAGFQAMMVMGNVRLHEGSDQIENIEANFTAYQELWLHDWYNRCWVNQEVVVADKVICLYGLGENQASWSLETLAMLVDRAQASEQSRVRKIPKEFWANPVLLTEDFGSQNAICVDTWAKFRRWYREGDLNLVQVLELIRQSNSTDPRDKVYSIWGLLNQEDKDGIPVDYSPVNTPERVFLNLAQYCISNPNYAIRILECAGVYQSVPGRPSWVPDWRQKSEKYPMDSRLYRATLKTKATTSISPSGMQIRVRGAMIDPITIVSPSVSTVAPEADLSREKLIIGVEECAYHMCKYLKANFGEYVTGEDYEDVLWRTLVVDRGWGHRRSVPEDKKGYKAFLTRWPGRAVIDNDPYPNGEVEVHEPAVPFSDTRDDHHDLVSFTAVASLILRGRVVCQTLRGMFGLVPEETVPGDVVVLLFGGNLPFVLRPVSDRSYVIVGHCYIHGIMDGGLLRIDENGEPIVESGFVGNFVIE